jgi:inorganic pyrophosphatase
MLFSKATLPLRT